MSVREVIVTVFLVLMVALQWLSCFGLLLMRNPYDRLHAVGPANVLPPLFMLAAILIQTEVTQVAIKTVLIALAVMLTSPVITHAIGRGVRISETGRLKPGK